MWLRGGLPRRKSLDRIPALPGENFDWVCGENGRLEIPARMPHWYFDINVQGDFEMTFVARHRDKYSICQSRHRVGSRVSALICDLGSRSLMGNFAYIIVGHGATGSKIKNGKIGQK